MPGFLPFARGTFMLDFVVVALFLVLPAVGVAIYQVRVRRNFRLHKWMQVGIAVTLLIAVVAFEVEMRLTGWQHLAEPSPYFMTWVYPSLFVHIVCATAALVSWSVTIFNAFKYFPGPAPRPNSYRNQHRRWGLVSAYSLAATAFSGWVFYYLAFIAS